MLVYKECSIPKFPFALSALKQEIYVHSNFKMSIVFFKHWYDPFAFLSGFLKKSIIKFIVPNPILKYLKHTGNIGILFFIYFKQQFKGKNIEVDHDMVFHFIESYWQCFFTKHVSNNCFRLYYTVIYFFS